MSLFWSACVAVLLAGAVGFGFVLIWHPIREFIGLRDRIKARVGEIERQRSRGNDLRQETESLRAVVSKAKHQQLIEAEHDLLGLADQMSQFPAKYPAATWVLGRMRFDPIRAAAGLKALANAIKLERAQEANRPRAPVPRPPQHVHRSSENVELRRRQR
jgi:hypothetical protein